MNKIILPGKDLSSTENGCHSVGWQIVNLILRDNPHLSRGERMTGPVCGAYDGYILNKELLGINSKTIYAKSIKVFLNEIDTKNFYMGDTINDKYIHYYTCELTTSNVCVGESINAIDNATFGIMSRPATQDDIDNSNYIVFRFGLSN